MEEKADMVKWTQEAGIEKGNVEKVEWVKVRKEGKTVEKCGILVLLFINYW